MDAIYPITALQRTPSKVKEAARSNLVRITGQGQGAYVFCSDQVFEERIRREREDAAYEARVMDSVDDAFERAMTRSKSYPRPPKGPRGDFTGGPLV